VRSDVDGRLTALEKACRAAGAKVTHQRREILRTVVESNDHPDARAVLERVREVMPTISFDTVYRTLSFLEEHELIHRVHAGGDRARFDGNSARHHHFFCRVCGRIIDFESEAVDGIDLSDEMTRLGSPEMKQLQVFGICRTCETKH